MGKRGSRNRSLPPGGSDFPTGEEWGLSPEEMRDEFSEAPELVGHDGVPCWDRRDLDPLSDLEERGDELDLFEAEGQP